MERMNQNNNIRVFLSLGSNLGNKLENLQQCVSEISKIAQLKKISSVYESPPWGYSDPNSYLNAVIQINTGESANSMLDKLLGIEKKLGRKRSVERPDIYNNRSIDIDILFFGSSLIEESELIIPHPRLHLRNFVLRPLVDVAPDFIHPALHIPLRDLLRLSPDKSEILKTEYSLADDLH